MGAGKCSGVLLLQLVFLVGVSVQNEMCGLPAPDPMKTCISVRLPWNPQPMYFCEDKMKFRYRNQCQNRFSTACGVNAGRTDTLMVASPWDCCPLVSYPDSCVNQQCPPAPHNRKCQTMEPNHNSPWECCQSYFCEENMTPETCHFKRLEPGCNTMPMGKTNCVAFVDPFGCCPKFQCDGDPIKPGHCPAHLEANTVMSRFNSTNMMLLGHHGYPGMMMPGGLGGGVVVGPGGAAAMAGHMEQAPPPPNAETGQGAEVVQQRLSEDGSYGRIRGAGSFLPFTNPEANLIACVGDFNCPGNMKCCSNDMNVYVKDDGRVFFRNRNPTYGYCMEAVATATITTKTIKYTAAK